MEENDVAFTSNGEEYQEATGLQYLRARHLNTAIGRFMPEDPYKGDTGNIMTQNRYAYGENDLVNRSDPGGIADGFNALIYLGQGDFKNAGISAAGMIPYIGDTAKGARLGAKALKFTDKADDVADTGKALKKAEKAAEAGKTAKAVLKNNQLPTEGEIRYVPPKKWTPSQPLPKKDGQIADKFGNKWIEGSSRTKGQYFEWDVKLSKKERAG